MLQTSTPLAYAGYFDTQPCWGDIVAKQRKENNISIPDSSTVLLRYQQKTMVLQKGVTHSVPSDAVLAKHGYDKLEVESSKHLMYDSLPQGEDLQ